MFLYIYRRVKLVKINYADRFLARLIARDTEIGGFAPVVRLPADFRSDAYATFSNFRYPNETIDVVARGSASGPVRPTDRRVSRERAHPLEDRASRGCVP